ncbi:MAG: helix-turn-helix domain-containing protein, partial [Planctomycetota bacterium]
MSYLSLEEAAAKLGISTDLLVELRSEGQVRGFRDGASWKFPDTEIDRLADELGADSFGSGILVEESDLGDGASIGSIIGGDATEEGDGSDLNIGAEKLKEGSTGGSDVNLVTGSKDDGSDVALVAAGDSELDSVDADFESEGLA